MPRVAPNFKPAFGAIVYSRNQAWFPQTSVDIYLKLTDCDKAVEVADEYVGQAPSDCNPRYRGFSFPARRQFRARSHP
jgi:hypothetical protein